MIRFFLKGLLNSLSRKKNVNVDICDFTCLYVCSLHNIYNTYIACIVFHSDTLQEPSLPVLYVLRLRYRGSALFLISAAGQHSFQLQSVVMEVYIDP